MKRKTRTSIFDNFTLPLLKDAVCGLMEEQNALSSELRSALIAAGYAADEINAMDADGLSAALIPAEGTRR